MLSVAVVIPCLNEVSTIAACVREAREAMSTAGLQGEVVVADNGSTDGSVAAAEAAGARVVPVPYRGYGSALHHGILGANADIVVFGDADLSYPFTHVADVVRPIMLGNASLVLGSRLRGKIEPGAMPFLNRFVGTPALSFLIRRLYGLPISDCNSGMRAIRKSDYLTLNLACPGMEYASEMLVRAAQKELAYAEVPITFRKDARPRAPHLARWRDGWRHFKFILGNAPSSGVVLAPALLGLVALLAAFILSFGGAWRPDHNVRYHSAFILIALALPLNLLSITFILIRMLTSQPARRDPLIGKLKKASENAAMFYTANLFFLGAFAQVVGLTIDWWFQGFGSFDRLPEIIRITSLSVVGTNLFCLDLGLGLLPLIPHRDTRAG